MLFEPVLNVLKKQKQNQDIFASGGWGK